LAMATPSLESQLKTADQTLELSSNFHYKWVIALFTGRQKNNAIIDLQIKSFGYGGTCSPWAGHCEDWPLRSTTGIKRQSTNRTIRTGPIHFQPKTESNEWL
jgi:hypothetical protein